MVAPLNSVSVQSVNPAGRSAGTSSERAALIGGGSGTDKSSFGSAINDALSEVSTRTLNAEAAAEAAAVGDLTSVTDYMIAASEAQLATEVTVAVRDRAISAFNDIMRMQI